MQKNLNCLVLNEVFFSAFPLLRAVYGGDSLVFPKTCSSTAFSPSLQKHPGTAPLVSLAPGVPDPQSLASLPTSFCHQPASWLAGHHLLFLLPFLPSTGQPCSGGCHLLSRDKDTQPGKAKRRYQAARASHPTPSSQGSGVCPRSRLSPEPVLRVAS